MSWKVIGLAAAVTVTCFGAPSTVEAQSLDDFVRNGRSRARVFNPFVSARFSSLTLDRFGLPTQTTPLAVFAETETTTVAAPEPAALSGGGGSGRPPFRPAVRSPV